MHPHLLLTASPVAGLRSLEDVRAGIASHPHAAALWAEIRAAAEGDLDAPALVPTSHVPLRSPAQAAAGNRDYTIVHAAGQRVLHSALVSLVTGDARFRATAMRQLESLFDDRAWPIWRDLAHPQNPADLRTGALCRDLGIAYDWLAPSLSPDERAWYIAGLDRRGLQPILESRRQGAWWTKISDVDMNNWHTCVVGGAGICAMALGDEHPQSGEIIDFANEIMTAYLRIYGPEGEYNESVGYSAATGLASAYFDLLRYHTAGRDNRLAQWPFPQACLWQLYFTLPPGRLAAFGDTYPERPLMLSHYPALADANRSGLLQWVYLTFGGPVDGRNLLLEFLGFNPGLKPATPAEAGLPLGRAFPAHGGCVSNRTSWDARSCDVAVYGKAGHGSEIHGHHDAGQLCIDGHGDRLIIDPGIPSLYPADFFGPNRHRYYSAGVVGHNVLMFDGRESAEGIERAARFLHHAFHDTPIPGGGWTLDLTGVYDGVESVTRMVAHLGPIVAVLDLARLPRGASGQTCSLRWHTAVRPELGPRGTFVVQTPAARLTAMMIDLGMGRLPLNLTARQQRYEPPFDRDRLGNPLVQRHEHYIEAAQAGQSWNWLTLFAVQRAGRPPATWRVPESGAEAQIEFDGGVWSVEVGGGSLRIASSNPRTFAETRT